MFIPKKTDLFLSLVLCVIPAFTYAETTCKYDEKIFDLNSALYLSLLEDVEQECGELPEEICPEDFDPDHSFYHQEQKVLGLLDFLYENEERDACKKCFKAVVDLYYFKMIKFLDNIDDQDLLSQISRTNLLGTLFRLYDCGMMRVRLELTKCIVCLLSLYSKKVFGYPLLESTVSLKFDGCRRDLLLARNALEKNKKLKAQIDMPSAEEIIVFTDSFKKILTCPLPLSTLRRWFSWGTKAGWWTLKTGLKVCVIAACAAGLGIGIYHLVNLIDNKLTGQRNGFEAMANRLVADLDRRVGARVEDLDDRAGARVEDLDDRAGARVEDLDSRIRAYFDRLTRLRFERDGLSYNMVVRGEEIEESPAYYRRCDDEGPPAHHRERSLLEDLADLLG